MPSKASAPKVTRPKGIEGESTPRDVKRDEEVIENIIKTMYQ